MRLDEVLGSNAGRQIVDVLTRRLRLMTVPQMATTWFSGDDSRARATAVCLERHSLLWRRRVLARPMLILDAPVVDWMPGGELPDFGSVAYRLRTRWTESAEPIEIVVATELAKRRFGGFCGGRWPRRAEISHDVSLAGVYLWYRIYKPEDAERWVPEAQLYAEGCGKGARLADAQVRRPEGGVERVVEFGGSYRKRKLEDFHREMCGSPYEIW